MARVFAMMALAENPDADPRDRAEARRLLAKWGFNGFTEPPERSAPSTR